MKRYRVRLPLTVHTDDGAYKQGEEFEQAFTEEEEAANLDSGLLEIVPRQYRVVGGSHVFDTAPGDLFEGALRIGQESQLMAGGHIERVAPAPSKRTPAKKEN